MKPLSKLSKKDRRFINYRASYCNARPTNIRGISKYNKNGNFKKTA